MYRAAALAVNSPTHQKMS